MFVCPECGASQAGDGPCAADGTPVARAGEDLLLGTTIGAYRVARLLGVGGMGRVYKGAHPAIGSRVAIKVLSRECSDRRDLVERFFAEARAVNLIRHESIVNVLDLATLPDGRPYIIMEYLDGAPLASLIEAAVERRAPLPLGGIARLTAEVLDALAAAHAKGIVHRDLKPDNVFVTPSGRPKVLDFGIAKLSDVSNASTRTGSLLGTPHYMSAEQAAGRPVDHRADLYAIGVILFECATGRKPFLAEALFDLLRMHVEAPPPSPRALRPDMPPAMEQVILTALAKRPEQRFASAAAMSMALQHATAQLAPEQWQPLAPGTRTTTGAAWAPTPPVSWSGGGSQPPAPHPALPPGPFAPTPSGAPPVMGAPRVAGARPASRRGLWIALSLVVVGGGITAAALLGGGKGAPGAGGAGAAGASAAGADPWGAVDPEDMTAAALAQLEASIQSLPPEQQKQLAMYRDLAKLPAAERMKKLRELTMQGFDAAEAAARQVEAAARAAGKGPQAEADDDEDDEDDGDDPAAAEAAQGDDRPAGDLLAEADPPAERPPPPPPATAWIKNHDIDPPSGYDPARVDVAAFLPWAIAQAKKAIPDAELVRIDTNGVGPDGRANLTLPSHASDHGSIDVRFISPSRGKRDPSQPLGVARRDFKCMFRVMAEPDGVSIMPIDFVDCARERVVAPPRCSVAAVWKKAIARKAPSQNAVGNVDYRASGARAVWYFAIGSGFDVVFSQTFPDDC